MSKTTDNKIINTIVDATSFDDEWLAKIAEAMAANEDSRSPDASIRARGDARHAELNEWFTARGFPLVQTFKAGK